MSNVIFYVNNLLLLLLLFFFFFFTCNGLAIGINVCAAWLFIEYNSCHMPHACSFIPLYINCILFFINIVIFSTVFY